MKSHAAILLALFLFAPAHAQRPAYVDPEISPEDAKHWSFAPPIRSPIPTVKNATWVRTPVDAFVLAKLEAAGLNPSPEADKLTLIRRVTFDLTGLPPTPAEIDSFLADPAPDAFEKLVDRLLASPHYGERWAQHWLDVVRFAETNGYEADKDRPHAWRYRDYVTRSLNADKPYDLFVREQIAGDLLAEKRDPRTVPDLYVATGLHRCGQVHMVGGNLDPEVLRQEVLTEMVVGVGSGILGITIGCARCHDHKFDPISLGDYYRLQAFFAGTKFKDTPLASDLETLNLGKNLALFQAKLAPIRRDIATIEAPYRAKLLAEKKKKLEPETLKAVETDPKQRTAEQKKLADGAGVLLKIQWDEVLDILSPEDAAKRAKLKEQQKEIEKDFPKLPAQAWGVADDEKPPTMYVLKRGDVQRKAIPANPAFPRVLDPKPGEPANRVDLANWVTKPDHPLTARVIVNRIWQHHFGKGIVTTPNDFGTRGDRPTHPELLDWLARELVQPTWGNPTPESAWTLKRIHRLLVLSAAYRQTSERGTANSATVDPDNKLLWRQNRLRLEAEAIRDAMLAAAGTLNPEIGGESVKVPLEPEVYDLIFTEGEPDNLWAVTPDVKQHTRRSMYLFLKRNVRQPILEAFDQPDTLNPCAARAVSTFAPQALILMNGPLAQEQSKAFALNLIRGGITAPAAQVEAIYRRALGRLPRAEETTVAVAFLESQTAMIRERLAARQPIGLLTGLPATADPATARALADLCLAVFNTNEFVFVK